MERGKIRQEERERKKGKKGQEGLWTEENFEFRFPFETWKNSREREKGGKRKREEVEKTEREFWKFGLTGNKEREGEKREEKNFGIRPQHRDLEKFKLEKQRKKN